MQEILSRLEKDLQEGRTSDVRAALKKIQLSTITRNSALPLSTLARRAALPYLALRFLRPYVRPVDGRTLHVTAEEFGAYAIALHNVGANEEALTILSSLVAQKTPIVWLYRAFILFSSWNYAEAIPDLELFVHSPDITSYQKSVGQLNLTAAYLATHNFDSAEALLAQLKSDAKANDLKLIFGGAVELSAQLFFERKEFAKARAAIEDQQFSPRAHNAKFVLWIKKWRALIDLYQHGVTTSNLLQLTTVKEEAVTLRDSETQRECDLHLAAVTQDEDLRNLVYVGTPSPAYRERILNLVPVSKPVPKEFLWIQRGNSANRGALDIFTGREEKSGTELKPGQATHRLLWALSRDFYRPVAIGSLFHYLFPKAYSDPDTSRDRLRIILRRTKTWFAKNSLPLSVHMELEEFGGIYSLKAESDFALKVHCDRADAIPDAAESSLARIFQHFGQHAFSAQQAAAALKSSLGTAIKVLNWGISVQKVSREVSAKTVRYHFAPVVSNVST